MALKLTNKKLFDMLFFKFVLFIGLTQANLL